MGFAAEGGSPWDEKLPRSTARVNFCPRGGLGPDFFSVVFNGFHDVSDDEVGEICYVTLFVG